MQFLSLRRSWISQWVMLGAGAAILACAGSEPGSDSFLDEARRTMHQHCHSGYDRCLEAAGPEKVPHSGCKDDLEACLSTPLPK